MAAGKYSLTIEQGATWELTITWNDDAGAPIDVTGYSAVATVKDTFGGTTLVSASTAAGTITNGGAAGTFAIVVPHATTAALEAPNRGVWDFEVTSPSGTRTRLLEGKAKITPEVTTT